MQFWQLLGDLHPKLVQFPLVLLLAGLAFDAVGLFNRSDRLHFAAKILSSVGTFFLLVAFICGIYAEIWAGRAGIPQDQIEWHELMANLSSWGFVILMAWRLFLDPVHRKSLYAYTTIGLAWYGLLVITGYLGGSLVFNYGAAVVGAQANDVLPLHDLNILATRQTDENLKYSEMMHHIFGWLTLALSGSLFAHAIFPSRADRLKWVGPSLLLLGGIFLFFTADLDLYKFTDLRQLRDREVQLHKTIALVLMTVGGLGLHRMRRHHHAVRAHAILTADSNNKQAEARIPAVVGAHIGSVAVPDQTQPGSEGFNSQAEPFHPSEISVVAGGNGKAEPRSQLPPALAHLSTPSKAVAVMALIGGGMLFTHVHTVAPYANVAAGVYIAHVVLGLVALGIGATRLLQDAVPRHRHLLAIAFAGLMCVESVLLITYNEGLPWYIGYGRYNRWGPHNGVVAPYGPLRAELTYDVKSRQLDLYVLDRFNDVPVDVPARQINVLISRGYSEIAVPLLAGGSGPSSSHFSAAAPFLQDAILFSARASLPVGSSLKMGFFDPWVDPLIHFVPPNEVATYQCPMHEGIIATEAGNCPACGMPMVPILLTPPTTLHDADYAMDLHVASAPAGDTRANGPIAPGVPALLTFTPRSRGELLRNLAIVHEHPMHLIIVSADLSFFDHVHPVPQPDGSLQLPYTFNKPGRYLLFADITPAGQRSQVFRLPVQVSTPGDTELLTDATPLEPSPLLAKPLAKDPTMTAQLIFQPRTPTAGTHTSFLFRLSKDGRPVNDLQPYIGAMGHCVIISQDTQWFIHCHPEQLQTPTADTLGGPDIPFHTLFPKPGLYKIWGQFQRNGQMVIADFVVEVKDPILPPKVINFLLND